MSWTTVRDSIEKVAIGAWDGFKSQANANIDEYTKSLIAGDKNVSILKSNLPYIRVNDALVKNKFNILSNESIGSYKSYYVSSGETTTIDDNPMLIDPYNDKRKIAKPSIKLNDGFFEANTDKVYTENQNGESVTATTVDGVGIGHSNIKGVDDTNGLIGKTKKWFQSTKEDTIGSNFNTLISRFHTDTEDSKDTTNEIQSAVSAKYGMSHGRNLLKTGGPTTDTGYEDPYCRTWTAFKSYWKYKDCIRPLNNNGNPATQNDLEGTYKWKSFRSPSYSIDNEATFESGGKRLASYGTMYSNSGDFTGLVNITPKWPSGSEYGDNNSVSVKRCMFSIENLAWKGQTNPVDGTFETDGLSPEQKGPLGGRIMWFPPYNLSFSESIGAQWNQHDFIGRGEPIYTYSNASRDGSLRFSMLIDHPAILDFWNRKHQHDTSTVEGSVDDINSDEQTLLRFFAGCNVLESQSNIDESFDDSSPTPSPQENPVNNDDKCFQFFVYFPNNYSGKDDKPNGNNQEVNAIEYLLNGVGTQQYWDEAKGDSETLATSMDITYKIDGNNFGGYEVDENRSGISGYKDPTNENIFQTITGTNGKSYDLYKQISNNDKKWSYRVDKDTERQNLAGGDSSYIDTTNFGLNGNGYQTGVDFWKKKGIISENDAVYSFVDVYTALYENNVALSGISNNENVNAINAIKNGQSGTITKIEVLGYASSQGNNAFAQTNTNRNKTLADNRAKTVASWIKNQLSVGTTTLTYTVDDNIGYDRNDPSIIEAKLTRCALVKIYYTTNSTTTDTGANSETETNISTNHSASSTQNSSIQSTDSTQQNTKKTAQNTVSGNNTRRDSAYGIRYDNEATFFQKLTLNSPHVAKLISDKVKYFSPVFHSLSPEGFNARLTFLQQCMRQGPTVNQSMGTNNPNNLAFGRPPVCVLRIGDFYNTKVIVTSLNIDYDPLTFDLNQEGIGVQPMIANITMQFHFIGGSDLAGPINRLQNALSFNYYANTGVYDNRSEEIKYNEQGEPEAFKPFMPLSLSNNYMQQ